MTWIRTPSFSQPITYSRGVYGASIDNNSELPVVIAIGHNTQNIQSGTFITIEDDRFESYTLPNIAQIRWLFPGLLDKELFYETRLILQGGCLKNVYYVGIDFVPHHRYAREQPFDSTDLYLDPESFLVIQAVNIQTDEGYDFTSNLRSSTQHTLDFLRAADSDGYKPAPVTPQFEPNAFETPPYNPVYDEYANGGHGSDHWQ
jgi:hypothetical protein